MFSGIGHFLYVYWYSGTSCMRGGAKRWRRLSQGAAGWGYDGGASHKVPRAGADAVAVRGLCLCVCVSVSVSVCCVRVCLCALWCFSAAAEGGFRAPPGTNKKNVVLLSREGVFRQHAAAILSHTAAMLSHAAIMLSRASAPGAVPQCHVSGIFGLAGLVPSTISVFVRGRGGEVSASSLTTALGHDS